MIWNWFNIVILQKSSLYIISDKESTKVNVILLLILIQQYRNNDKK